MITEYFFPTPIWYEILEDITQSDLQHLKESCLLMSRSQPGVKISNCGGWQSPGFYINTCSDNYLSKLMSCIAKRVHDMNLEFNPPEELKIDNFWINVNRRGDYNRQHLHPNTLLSGVFYISGDIDSGDLIFYRSNNSESMLNSLICRNLAGFSQGEVRHRPQPSKLVIFPSWLPHSVDTNNTDSIRISLAFNINYTSQVKI